MPDGRALLPWWLDFVSFDVAQLVLGAASLLMGSGAIWLAWRVAKRQFLVMDQQTGMMKEQGEIAEAQKQLAEEQGRLAKRQGEIAERQFEIGQEQMSRRAILEIRFSFLKFTGPPAAQRVHLEIGVFNSGTRSPEDGLYWQIFFPTSLAQKGNLNWDEPGTAQSEDSDRFGEPGHWYLNHLKDPVFPRRTTIIGQFDTPADTFQTPYLIGWLLIAADGVFPSEDDNGELQLTKQTLEEMYRRALPKGHRLRAADEAQS